MAIIRYVVRAYRLCVEELVDVCHLRQPGNWRDIWRLKFPPKVKHLICCMCRGCLPTRIRLQDKGVLCPTRCVSCVVLPSIRTLIIFFSSVRLAFNFGMRLVYGLMFNMLLFTMIQLLLLFSIFLNTVLLTLNKDSPPCVGAYGNTVTLKFGKMLMS